MNNPLKVNRLIEMVENFIEGGNRSIEYAGRIEVLLDELFTDIEEIQEVVTDFACYRPGGGEYLFDEKAMVKKCINLLKTIDGITQ